MMLGRPELNKELGSKKFMEFYYSDEELISFLDSNGIDTGGGRDDLIDKTLELLGGKKLESLFVIKEEAKDDMESDEITEYTLIEEDFEYTNRHKEFFTTMVGADFHMYDELQSWMELHPGHPYSDAVDMWYVIDSELQ